MNFVNDMTEGMAESRKAHDAFVRDWTLPSLDKLILTLDELSRFNAVLTFHTRMKVVAYARRKNASKGDERFHAAQNRYACILIHGYGRLGGAYGGEISLRMGIMMRSTVLFLSSGCRPALVLVFFLFFFLGDCGYTFANHKGCFC